MIWRSCITHRFVSLMFSCTIGVPKGPLFAPATWVLRKDAHAGTLDAAKVNAAVEWSADTAPGITTPIKSSTPIFSAADGTLEETFEEA